MPLRKARQPGRSTTSRSHRVRLIGAHQSIAGGLPKAVERAIETGCTCLQIFTRNINQWAVKPLDPDAFLPHADTISGSRWPGVNGAPPK